MVVQVAPAQGFLVNLGSGDGIWIQFLVFAVAVAEGELNPPTPITPLSAPEEPLPHQARGE